MSGFSYDPLEEDAPFCKVISQDKLLYLNHRPPENNLYGMVWIPPSVCQGLNVQSTEYHRSLSTDAEVALDWDYLLNLSV